jgi:cell division protein FtsQ
LTEGDRLDFPVLTGITEDELARDQAGTRALLKRARDLIAMLSVRKSFGLDNISEIHCDPGYGFTLFTAQGGVPIKLGNSDFDEKLGRLAKIYPGLQPQMPMLAYIDLDYGDRIIVKKV